MKRSTKAALLSGLIFPGIGHMYLKRYVVTTALEVAEKIQSESGGVALDMGAITDLVSQQSSGAEQPTNIAMIALVVCWVVGIADSYRQGRTQERVEKVACEKET